MCALTGNVFQLSIVGKPMIVVNTAEEARELLEKRGAINSDRPKTLVHGEMYEPSRRFSSQIKGTQLVSIIQDGFQPNYLVLELQ